MPVIAGSVWVEGQYLHFCPTTTTEYRYLGTYVANRSTALAGSMWVEGQFIRYIDSNKDERFLPSAIPSTPAGVSSAINGSVWIENNRLCSIEQNNKQKIEYHDDVSFSDHSDHTDCVYSDNGPHQDFYTNHSDFTGDPAFFHIDQHFDAPNPHFDFNDCNIGHADNTNTSHSDAPEFVGSV